MRLSDDTIQELVVYVDRYISELHYEDARDDIERYLQDLDLVVKPGDSSQSVLVNQNKKG